MDKRKDKIIVWNVTAKCNLDCEFCFGPNRKEKELNFDEAKKKILEFKKTGAKKLVFTGGEPLLREDIVSLIRFAKNHDFFTILHTNGLLLREDLFDQFGDSLDQINLPLDGSTEKTNSKMRARSHFKTIFQIFSWLKKKKIKVIISTVATKINAKDIVQIGGILPSFIHKWRIFQFNPQGKAAQYKDKYFLSDEEFTKLENKVKSNKYDFEIQMVANKDKKFYESYYLI